MILVFGQSGQLARALRDIDPDIRCLSRNDADLEQPKSCLAAIEVLRPDAVINAAAYTHVDRAEDEEALAMRINADAPAAMAAACGAIGIPLVTISSDYVFDGEGNVPHRVGSPIAPRNAYGRSKAAGEAAVRQSGAIHAILRTSWIFSQYSRNFVTTMLELGKNRSRIEVVSDQIGGPTPASALAKACLATVRRLILEPGLSGTYHYAGAPDLSWADFARTIFEESDNAVEIVDTLSDVSERLASRPLNSRLDCSSLSRLDIERPDWRPALRQIVPIQVDR